MALTVGEIRNFVGGYVGDGAGVVLSSGGNLARRYFDHSNLFQN